jgi:glycosyltransferase involved in cell wall biosynthesis
VKISVLCFDLADNALGRADLLARLVAPLGSVEIVGPQHGPAPWEPVARDGIPSRAVAGRRFPGFLRSMQRLLALADGDLLYASKTRLGSAGVGLIKRHRAGRPLLIDIDDWEVGFFLRSGLWGTAGRALNLGNPKGLPWTWLTERLARRADGITVASRFLERRFGGLLIPHVRDTEAWQPGRVDPDEGRRRLGIRGERVVMFLGTPRAYKGIDDLCEAVERLARPDVVLALVGGDPAGETARGLPARHPGIRLVGRVPFDDVPVYLAAADVVAVPQRETTDTRGQVPAKLFDAMALGRPIVSTRVSMIPEILEGCGLVVPPGDVDGLAAGIGRLLDDPALARDLGGRARERCVARYSFEAARRSLFPLIESLTRRE